MMKTSRRAFVSGAVSVLSAASLGGGMSRAATIPTRYDVASAEGKAMLRIYADAVGKMMSISAGDPRSWTFQWYTHFVRSDRTKASEIARIYTSASDARRSIAEAMWNTCEAHSDATREDFFLPWHRMYVFHFEEIVREVSGREEFMLPYWNYTDELQRAIPGEFRLPNDPVWKNLYRSSRKVGVNEGKRIDKLASSLPIDLDAMKSPSYRDTGGDAGLCANIDNAPHGSVHVNVGDAKGMGRVPWAANDPIFWLHHCNIDRIWASWNGAGGKNPSDDDFVKERFTFVNRLGKPVTEQVGDWLDTTGYRYQDYIPRPPGSAPFPLPNALVAGPETLLIASAKVGLSKSETTRIALTAANPGALANPDAVNEALRSASDGSNVYLRLNGVLTQAEAAVAYDVFFAPPDGVSREHKSYVGTISLFGSEPHGDTGGHDHSPSKGRNYSFLITDRIQSLAQRDGSQSLLVSLVPIAGSRQGTAAPTISSVALVRA